MTEVCRDAGWIWNPEGEFSPFRRKKIMCPRSVVNTLRGGTMKAK